MRQTERHLHSDPPTAGELRGAGADVRAILAAGVPEERRRRSAHAIAVAGTATSLAAIAQELDPYDPDKVHGYVRQRRRVRADPRAAGGDDARAAPRRSAGCTRTGRRRSSPA